LIQNGSLRLKDEFIFINKGWATLRSWLQKRYGPFGFLKILEGQKTGLPHLHVLIQGFPHVPNAELGEIWQKYGGGYVYVKQVAKNLNAVNYVLKYVNKTILGKNPVYAALLFASNKRIFSMSQSLMRILNVKPHPREQGWKFAGVVKKHVVEQFCLEENIPYDNFIRVEVATELLYKYQVLFDVSEDEFVWKATKDG